MSETDDQTFNDRVFYDYVIIDRADTRKRKGQIPAKASDIRSLLTAIKKANPCTFRNVDEINISTHRDDNEDSEKLDLNSNVTQGWAHCYSTCASRIK
jgi:hypothetical protein